MRLKELRKSNNLTLKNLSEELGFSAQVLSRYELEQTQPDFNSLIKIARFFDVTVDYLIGASDFKIPFNSTLADQLSSEEWQLVEDYRKLSPALKEMLQDTIKTWSDSTANKRTKKDA